MQQRSKVWRGTLIEVSLLPIKKGRTLTTSVPARLIPTAVGRNQVKRWLRELYRHSRFAKNNHSIDIRLKKGVGFTHEALKTDLRKAESELLS